MLSSEISSATLLQAMEARVRVIVQDELSRQKDTSPLGLSEQILQLAQKAIDISKPGEKVASVVISITTAQPIQEVLEAGKNALKPKKTVFKLMYFSTQKSESWESQLYKSEFDTVAEAAKIADSYNAKLTSKLHGFYFVKQTEVDA